MYGYEIFFQSLAYLIYSFNMSFRPPTPLSPSRQFGKKILGKFRFFFFVSQKKRRSNARIIYIINYRAYKYREVSQKERNCHLCFLKWRESCMGWKIRI